jgi:hypothetical protein
MKKVALADVLTESLAVEPEVAGVADQVAQLEAVLVAQEQVMHFPERALGSGGIRGLGGELGMGVNVVEWQVLPHVPGRHRGWSAVPRITVKIPAATASGTAAPALL